jgi:hypothetical protein
VGSNAESISGRLVRDEQMKFSAQEHDLTRAGVVNCLIQRKEDILYDFRRSRHAEPKTNDGGRCDF